MPRERKSRTWIKIDCEGILRGSINYLLTLEGQAIWVKMIALADVCGGRAGYIEDNNHKGLPDEFIAHELHCSVEQLKLVKERMKEDGAINVNGTGSIQLVNFSKYQFGEYDRQKVYRKKEGEGKQTFEEYVEAIRKDYNDLNIEEELEKFKLWWEESGKELKRPKAAFRNWLVKAREFKQENYHNKKENKTQVKTGKYHHMVKK
jgi:hypothetical protein